MLKYSNFSNGFRYPIIYRTKEQFIPILLPLAYLVIRLQPAKALGTIKNQLHVIDDFYAFFESKELELDELLLKGNFADVFAGLKEFFLVYVYTSKKEKAFVRISSHSHSHKLSVIRDYLQWNFSRYVYSQVTDYKQRQIEENLYSKLTAFFDAYTHIPSIQRKNYKSISQEDLSKLLKIVHPDHSSNPFLPYQRMRNYLIYLLFCYTGIRLSELLLLKSKSLFEQDGNYYIKVQNRFDGEDSRKDRPSMKNSFSERIIAISQEIFDLINYYILYLRRLQRNGKSMKLSHGFLFTSELGNPLSKSSIVEIFKKINNLLPEIKKFSSKLSPHMLRHTFADTFLKYLLEVRNLDMERAKDELRMVCGWSPNSVMPVHYANRYISTIANQHNLERIESLYKIHP